MNDQRLENIIGQLLRAGVLLAAVIVFAGGVGLLIQHPHERVDYQHFVAGGPDIRTVRGIAHSAFTLESRGIIQFGLLLLIATPVARVVMAVIGFSLERDWMYVVVSAIVFAVLLASLLHAT
jgi:uncharacterized membrane protein